MPMTLPNTYKMTEITYTPQVSGISEVDGAPFQGTAIISYCPDLFVLEFNAFDKWLLSLATRGTTIEGLTRTIFDKVESMVGNVAIRVSVEVTAQTHAPASATIIRGMNEL